MARRSIADDNPVIVGERLDLIKSAVGRRKEGMKLQQCVSDYDCGLVSRDYKPPNKLYVADREPSQLKQIGPSVTSVAVASLSLHIAFNWVGRSVNPPCSD